MLNQLRQFLKPPIFEDEQLNAKARLLNNILLAIFAVSVLQFIVVPLTIEVDADILMSMFALPVFTLAGMWLLHRRKIMLAGGILVFGLWIIITMSVLDHGSIQNPAFGIYVIVVLMAGLLFDVRVGVGVLVLSIGAGVLFVILERQGVTTDNSERLSAELVLFIELIKLLLAPAFLYAYSYRINVALTSVQKSHAELQVSQLSLKNRSVALAEANEALRQSEARYRTLFDNAPEAIVVIDVTKNCVVDVNYSGLALFGYAYEAFCGLSPAGLSAPSFPIKETLPEAFRAVSEGATPTYEWVLVDKSGHTFPCEIRLVRLPDTSRRLIRASIIDVSEKRHAEQLLQQAQKLESLGILAGGIAHDFNNLLVAMLGQTSLALMKLERNAPAGTHIEKAIVAAQQAAQLTNQMLAFSGRGQFEVRSLDLNALIEANLSLFAAGVSKHITLTPSLNAIAFVRADRSQMQQVIMNLALNAAQAIPAGRVGEIKIGTQMRRYAEGELDVYGRYTGERLPAGTYVCLIVQDNGVGMDDTTRARIFDPFFTTKMDGSGLGLAAVLGIVRGHGGGLCVDSEPGRGTTFTLIFPPHQEPPPPPLAPAIVRPTNQSLRGNILIIDDEASVQEAIQAMLDPYPIQTWVAQDGATGVRTYQKHQAEIDLVILDLSMPGMSGKETLAALRQLNPAVKVILSSGFSDVGTFDKMPAIDFLPKPYDNDALIAKISQHLPY